MNHLERDVRPVKAINMPQVNLSRNVAVDTFTTESLDSPVVTLKPVKKIFSLQQQQNAIWTGWHSAVLSDS